jgi:RNA polymerase sigma factor (sigma-70 family)
MKMSIAMLDTEKLQKLFYFSLKKTGNQYDAEELVQETALEMIKMLNRNYEPAHFNAWMWTVAKKRYARWCKNKQVKLSRYELDDISDYARIADDSCVEEDILLGEDIELLRRELALLTKDYREIVVSYYFGGEKIDAISKMTGLPEGTVKRKLHEARKNIKEGMKMARTKGQRSYAPEDIAFAYNINIASGGYPLGQPWNLLKSLARKNIVLEAYNNPSTVEELSLALGIASPYIEDELVNLLETNVMVKHNDGRIETNFVIIDADTQKQLMAFAADAEQICPIICGVIEKNIDKIRNIGFINHDMPKEYLYWCLFYLAVERLIQKVAKSRNAEHSFTKRPNGDEWDITAFEHWDAPTAYSSFCNRTNDENSHFDHYKIDVDDLMMNDGEYGISGNELSLLTDIIKNKRTKSNLDASEMKIVDSLVSNHVVTISGKSGDDIKVKFPVFNESEKQEFTAFHNIIREIYEGEAYNKFAAVYDSICKILSGALPARFKDNHIKSNVALNDLYNFRCVLMRYADKNGIIKMPDGDDKSAITMYMRY